MARSVSWKILVIWPVILYGAENTDLHKTKMCSGKKRKENDASHNYKKLKTKTPEASLQLSTLPTDTHHLIFDFLSSGIHRWSMCDRSIVYKTAISSWCNFAAVSKVWRSIAHDWASQHFGISESEYELFKRVQIIRYTSYDLMKKALNADEISYRAEWEISCHPFDSQSTKKGLWLLMSSPSRDPEVPVIMPTLLRTPWGTLCLFPRMESDTHWNIEPILAQRLKIACDSLGSTEQVELYKPNERRTRTNAAARIIWNILRVKVGYSFLLE